MFEHYFAELECDILGHIDCRIAGLGPVTVTCHNPDGTNEKLADNRCANCGHFIIDGATHIRSDRFTPDYLKNDPPEYIRERRARWQRAEEMTRQ
jgi:hypothetical protein